MKAKLTIVFAIVAAIIINTSSCKKEDSSITTPQKVYLDLPSTPYNYSSGGIFTDNNVATLGRVLFYDSHLSVNNAISCGTCHKQTLAFSDNVAFSRGFENKLTKRNTLPIQNVAVSSGVFGNTPSLFWDGREKFLQSMVLKPIVNHVEMGMSDVIAIADKVKSLPYYQDLFQKAFNSTDVDIIKIAQALSAFTGSIISSNTLFDKVNFGQATLSGLQAQGQQLFFTKYNCNSCHQTQAQNGYEMGGGFVNIGLDMEYADNGTGSLNGNTSENGKFRIPNLRNIALTAPYMHDGRFATLEDVLIHYSHGISNHPNLDSRLKGSDSLAIQMNISSQEKGAIIAFLNTLTDYSMITDPKFSSPFKFQ